MFVFRLMFRIYWLPDKLADYLASADRGSNTAAVYYGRKRMLEAFSARRYAVTGTRGGRPVGYGKYLMVSAIAEDDGRGACSALRGNLCGIHERRPLACRSVPLHYARAEATAADDLAAFAETRGYRCDTSVAAPAVIEGGRIVDPGMVLARGAAIGIARRDRRWGAAIVARLGHDLPSLAEIEANAGAAATTMPMTAAWEIAVGAGLMNRAECDRLAALQQQVGNYASLSA